MDMEMNEKKLYDACLEGDVEMLVALIKEDKDILSRVSVSSSFQQRTPLYLACMLGHHDFAKSVLSYKPEFARKSDLHGRSPLHLASANGYAKIIRLLLDYDVNLGQKRDEDGKTPLHLAVLNGEVDAIAEFSKVSPDHEDTLLHLCVLYGRLDVLVTVLEQSNTRELLNNKNDEGNTIIHSAAALGRTKIIKYLMKRSDVDLNLPNEKGLTALEIVEQMPEDVKTIEIKKLLISASNNINRSGVEEVVDDSREGETTIVPAYIKLGRMWKKWAASPIFSSGENDTNSVLVAASVLIAMNYQAVLSPPSGIVSFDATLKNDTNFNSDPFRALTPLVSFLFNSPKSLSGTFWMCTTVSFMTSITIIILYVLRVVFPISRFFFLHLLYSSVWLTLASILLAYGTAVLAIRPHNEKGELITWVVYLPFVSAELIYVCFIVCLFFVCLRIVSVPKIKKKKIRIITTNAADAPSPATTLSSNIV